MYLRPRDRRGRALALAGRATPSNTAACSASGVCAVRNRDDQSPFAGQSTMERQLRLGTCPRSMTAASARCVSPRSSTELSDRSPTTSSANGTARLSHSAAQSCQRRSSSVAMQEYQASGHALLPTLDAAANATNACSLRWRAGGRARAMPRFGAVLRLRTHGPKQTRLQSWRPNTRRRRR